MSSGSNSQAERIFTAKIFLACIHQEECFHIDQLFKAYGATQDLLGKWIIARAIVEATAAFVVANKSIINAAALLKFKRQQAATLLPFIASDQIPWFTRLSDLTHAAFEGAGILDRSIRRRLRDKYRTAANSTSGVRKIVQSGLSEILMGQDPNVREENMNCIYPLLCEISHSGILTKMLDLHRTEKGADVLVTLCRTTQHSLTTAGYVLRTSLFHYNGITAPTVNVTEAIRYASAEAADAIGRKKGAIPVRATAPNWDLLEWGFTRCADQP